MRVMLSHTMVIFTEICEVAVYNVELLGSRLAALRFGLVAHLHTGISATAGRDGPFASHAVMLARHGNG